MHVHFDEALFERDLRAAFDKVEADPAVHDVGSIILDRNRDLSVQFGMMLCRELNRGTEPGEILVAGGTAFVEFFSNMLQYFDDEAHPEVAAAVTHDLIQAMADVLDGHGVQLGEPATMQEVPGGHA